MREVDLLATTDSMFCVLGMLPGIAYYLSRWYTKDELAFRLALYIGQSDGDSCERPENSRIERYPIISLCSFGRRLRRVCQ